MQNLNDLTYCYKFKKKNFYISDKQNLVVATRN